MFERLLEQIARGLDSAGLPYMVIGAQAVLLYGEPRLTRDIDVTLGAGPERLQDVLDLVAGQGWKVLADNPVQFVGRTMVLPCEDPKTRIRIDFIFSFSTYEQQAFSRVRKERVGNAEVRFASAEDLIIHKVIAGRPRDLEDVRSILLKRLQVDEDYICRWLKEFEVSLGSEFVKKFHDLWKSISASGAEED